MSQKPDASFWTELKERRVVRVGVVYTVVSWGVVTVAAQLTDILTELPGWLPRVVLILAVLGFPIALVLAWAFELTPDGVRRAEPTRRTGSRAPFLAGLAAGVASVSLLAFLVAEPGGDTTSEVGEDGALDPDLVAVMPFSYSGPPEFSYLGDGVFQLLSARFTGEVGPRATDPTATSALLDESVETGSADVSRLVARRLNAGLVISGSVVAGPDGLSLNAALEDVRTGEATAAASSLGPVDSLTAVVQRLSAELLSLSVGEYRTSLDQLTSADPDALNEYLKGQVKYRQGDWTLAYDDFQRAVSIDSTFALAWMWMAEVGANVAGGLTTTALERAMAHPDRLTPADRAYLEARLGPNYPSPSTRADRREALLELSRRQPERAAIWYQLGEVTVHFPRSAEDLDLAFRYFDRGVELDPRDTNARGHRDIPLLVQGRLEEMQRFNQERSTELARAAGPWQRAVIADDSAAAVAAVAEYTGTVDFGVRVLAPMDNPRSIAVRITST